MKTKAILICTLLLGLCFLTITSIRAQISQFGQATFLQCQTNSGVLVTTVYSVSVPAISLSITATNTATIITNYLGNSLFIGGSNVFVGTMFIYNAATMGTNFSTNFNAYSLSVTSYTFGEAIPMLSGGSNAYIK